MRGIAIVLPLMLGTLVSQSMLASPAWGQTSGTKTAPSKSTGKTGKVEGGKVATYSSPFFVLNTDLDPVEAKALLKRLDTMIGLISKYWGKAPQGIIECYVAKDLNNWPPNSIDPEGAAHIAAGGGVTLTQTLTLGKQFKAKSVVYAVADHGTPQHEAVHAYCGQNFGTTGPTWYSEGMAEMGQYWVEGERAVNAHPTVVKYIRETPPKGLLEIVDPRSVTGDSWQNYAWRWALCHLLANNPNYAARFHPLGMGFLTKQEVSFESVYGEVAREISFEYLFFLKNLDRGFRVDLCAWDWKKKCRPLGSSAPSSTPVDAARGWQSSGVSVAKDTEYEYAAKGTWKTTKSGTMVDANGAEDGSGKLVGVIFKDYQLGEPFDLGRFGSFTAPEDGSLYIRCREDFHEIADNTGKLTLTLKLKGKGEPLTDPALKKGETKETKADAK